MKTKNTMNDEIKKLVNSSKVWVDYYGRRGGYGGYDDCVDVLTKDDLKRDNISNVYVRFMDANYCGVAIRLSDGSMWRIVDGKPGCSNHEDLGYMTYYDYWDLVPLYNKEYLDRYSKAFEEDEWVDDMTADGMVGIRDDFNTFANGMRRTDLTTTSVASYPDYEGVAIRDQKHGFNHIERGYDLMRS